MIDFKEFLELSEDFVDFTELSAVLKENEFNEEDECIEEDEECEEDEENEVDPKDYQWMKNVYELMPAYEFAYLAKNIDSNGKLNMPKMFDMIHQYRFSFDTSVFTNFLTEHPDKIKWDELGYWAEKVWGKEGYEWMEQIEPYGPSWQTEEFEIRWSGEHEKWKAESPDELLDDYEKEKEEKNQVIDPSTVLFAASISARASSLAFFRSSSNFLRQSLSEFSASLNIPSTCFITPTN